jgi:hypothetical protein
MSLHLAFYTIKSDGADSYYVGFPVREYAAVHHPDQ